MNPKKYRIYLVDDDPVILRLLKAMLEAEGHAVTVSNDSARALADIVEQKPDCVVLDIMMPELDGLQLCRRLRASERMAGTRIVMLTGKQFEFDRQRAFEFGADGYFMKPVDQRVFIGQLHRIIEDRIDLTLWGVRGTLPVPGKKSLKYGGNTSCISLDFPRGDLLIFDAGSGIKVLSDHLVAQNRFPLTAKIFVSHPHWDHINALPFFVPLYMQGNEFEILGPSQGDLNMRDLISGQMDGVYFPIKIKEFAARVDFRDLQEESFTLNAISIRTLLLNHPGYCLGYRVEYKGRSICYCTDNELDPPSSPYYNENFREKMRAFIHRADVLITDTTYTGKEYAQHVGWGHSAVEQVAELAHLAEVETLCLFHHDPDQTDTDIDAKLEIARQTLEALGSRTRCIAPIEGEVFRI